MDLFKRKQGESNVYSTMIGMVLGISILLIVLVVLREVYDEAAGIPDESVCRTSIRTHSKLVSLTAQAFSTDIECDPQIVKIDTRDEQAAKLHLARTMKFCWDRWQRGTLELFQEDGIFCNPCAFIEFTDAREYLQDFPHYYATTPIKKDGVTFHEYMSSFSSDLATGNVPQADPPRIPQLLPTDEDMAVLFVTAKGEAVVNLKEYFYRNPPEGVEATLEGAAIGAYYGALGGGFLLLMGVASGPVGWVVIGMVTGAAAGGYLAFNYGAAELPQWVSHVVLIPNRAEDLERLGCTLMEQRTLEGAIKDV